MKYTQQLPRVSRLPQAAFALFLGCLLALSTSLSLANEADLTGSSRGISLEIFSQLSPIVINTIHSWEVVLTDENGAVSGATLDIVGGMPEHNHGMPTQPQITEEVTPGRYLLEGVRFHMPGLWRLTASISTEKTRGRPPTVIAIDFTL